jgi:hypothetical protein
MTEAPAYVDELRVSEIISRLVQPRLPEQRIARPFDGLAGLYVKLFGQVLGAEAIPAQILCQLQKNPVVICCVHDAHCAAQ